MDNGKSNLPHRLIYELGHTFAEPARTRRFARSGGAQMPRGLRCGRRLGDAARSRAERVLLPVFFRSRSQSRGAPRWRCASTLPRAWRARSCATAARSGSISVKHDPNFYSVVDKHTGFQTRSIIAALLMAGDTRLGVIEVLNPIHLRDLHRRSSRLAGSARGEHRARDQQRQPGGHAANFGGKIAHRGRRAAARSRAP